MANYVVSVRRRYRSAGKSVLSLIAAVPDVQVRSPADENQVIIDATPEQVRALKEIAGPEFIVEPEVFRSPLENN